jgi:arginase
MNLFFPQWQGGTDFERYTRGATFLRDMLEPRVEFVNVPINSSLDLSITDNIKAKPVLLEQLKAVRTLLETRKPERVFTLGGDCACDLVQITYLNQLYAGELSVVWLDAHADLNTPESSPSKHFHGMPLRSILGEGDSDVLKECFSQLKPRQVIFVGLRELDPPEEAFLEQHEMIRVRESGLRKNPNVLANQTIEANSRNLYIHFDLDVLEPSQFDGTRYPTPNGMTLETVIDTIQSLSRAYNIVGFALTEFAPKDLEHAHVLKPKLERILEVLPVF